MQDQIKQELKRLESENEIKILYAIESGSRAWGFASTDSDWDVRFIYVHKPEWYLSINDKKDSLEQILPNDIDLGGWEIRKALKLFNKSNPPLMEWLRSPILYSETGAFADSLRSLSKDYFNPKNCLHHYLHMAEGNFREYLQKDVVRTKKYFYVLRPVLACMWIENKNSMPPMEFQVTFKEFVTDGLLKNEIETLLIRKMSGEELSEDPKIEVINNFLDEKIKYYQELVKSFPSPNRKSNEPLNDLFRNTLKQSWYNGFS
jgi:predicted nucleotidyltransferase